MKKGHLRRVLLKLFLFLFVGYLVFVLALYLMQATFIFPGHARQGWLAVRIPPSPTRELLNLKTAQGDRIAALYGSALMPEGQPHPNPSTCPTLLYFYGNGNSVADNLDLMERFRRMGVNVLMPDYVGYGMSGGKPSETACYQTADAAYHYLRSERGVKPEQIVMMGWSLGGAVAIDLASREPVGKLIALSTFTSMTDMARGSYPYVPVSLLLRHRFDSVGKIGRVKCPILLIHGTADRLVPYSMLARLAQAAHAPVTQYEVEGARHNDLVAVGGEPMMQKIERFIHAP